MGQGKKEADLKAKYEQCVGREAQQRFRMEWAKNMKQEIEEEHFASSRIMTKEMIKGGEYMPFAVVVEREGWLADPRGALQRAKNYLQGALELGNEWVRTNSMTKAVEVLYFKTQVREAYVQQYKIQKSLKNKEEKQGMVDMEAASPVDATAANAPTSSSSVMPSPKAVGKRSPPSCIKAEGPKKAKTVNKEVQQHTTALVRAVQLYHVTMSMTLALTQEIGQKKEWSWANNDEVVNDMNVKKDNLECHMHTDPILIAAVAGEPINSLKNLAGFEDRIKVLASCTPEKVKALKDTVTKLRKMQAVRVK